MDKTIDIADIGECNCHEFYVKGTQLFGQNGECFNLRLIFDCDHQKEPFSYLPEAIHGFARFMSIFKCEQMDADYLKAVDLDKVLALANEDDRCAILEALLCTLKPLPLEKLNLLYKRPSYIYEKYKSYFTPLIVDEIIMWASHWRIPQIVNLLRPKCILVELKLDASLFDFISCDRCEHSTDHKPYVMYGRADPVENFLSYLSYHPELLPYVKPAIREKIKSP